MSDDLIGKLRHLAPAERSFRTGAYLFHRQDRVRWLHLVEAGMVHLIRHQADGAALILQRAGPGEILAEASVFSSSYHCDAIARQHSRVRLVPLAALQAALAQSTGLASAWAAHLAQAVQRARLRAEILSLRTVAARLDAWLDWHGGAQPAKGGWKLLAAEIGASPEALYRELARRR